MDASLTRAQPVPPASAGGILVARLFSTVFLERSHTETTENAVSHCIGNAGVFLECGGLTPLWLTPTWPVAINGWRQTLKCRIACSSRLAPRVRHSQHPVLCQDEIKGGGTQATLVCKNVGRALYAVKDGGTRKKRS